MKILLVIAGIGPVYGGTSKLVVEMAQALSHRDIEVDLITTPANDKTDLNVPILTWIQEENYRVQYFPYSRLFDFKFTVSMTLWLWNNVKKYDLVHTIAIFNYPVLAAHIICQFYKVPYIMNPQGMLEPWALSNKAWKKNLYYNLLEKSALQKASAIQMLSQAELKGIEPLKIQSPIFIIPNGIHRHDLELLPEPEIFYQKFPETKNKILILFLGRIDPKKGLDLLAKAFAEVSLNCPQAHLVVAGPDNIGFLATAKNFFAEKNCLHAVTFTGMLVGSLKKAALAAANIYIAPSYSEGFSMSVLEGMAAGLPCVITTGCNFPEAAIANAAKVVDIDAEEIFKALSELINQPQKSKAMGERARQFIFEKYTWQSVASQLHRIYTDTISPPQKLDPDFRNKLNVSNL